MNLRTKEFSKFIYCTVQKNIYEKIIQLLLCYQNRKELTNSDLLSIQRKLSHLDKEFRYSKILIKGEFSTPTTTRENKFENILKYLEFYRADFQKIKDTLTEPCENGYENIVKYIVEHGADVQGNKKALALASKNGHETIVKYLVERGADVQGNGDALISACRNGHETIVNYLVEHGADDEKRNNNFERYNIIKKRKFNNK